MDSLPLFALCFHKSTPMTPHRGLESRQVMSPNHDLLPAQLRTSLVQRITSHRDAQEVFHKSSLQGALGTVLLNSESTGGRTIPSISGLRVSDLRTVQKESENSFRQLDDNTTAFTHLPSPQGVCHTVFSLNSSHLTRMSKQLGGKNPCNSHSTEPRVDHNIALQQLRLLSLYHYTAEF